MVVVGLPGGNPDPAKQYLDVLVAGVGLPGGEPDPAKQYIDVLVAVVGLPGGEPDLAKQYLGVLVAVVGLPGVDPDPEPVFDQQGSYYNLLGVGHGRSVYLGDGHAEIVHDHP